ncbi:MAG: 1-deoxy-D-xylulose-5-phosphate reductoisomerase [Gammaproteobacteria bacterium]
MSRGITLLGSTGSIGCSALDVIARNAAHYHVVALTANTDVDQLEAQCLKWQPEFAVMCDADAAENLRQRLQLHASDTEVLAGVEGLSRVAGLAQVDTVIAGIVGAAGLLPALAAAEAGKRILLANKEALVMSGSLFMDTVKQHSATLLPVDSEHNAIFQCLPAQARQVKQHGEHHLQQQGVKRILLTASGGPFRTRDIESLSSVTPAQAVNHPNWDMGRKISVDSATMMNKGLEVIEARWLFDISESQIDVVIHPQSVIHSMVSYNDGSVLAQLGNPDMRTPIAHALAWPERISSGVEPLDIFKVAKLEFEKPDLRRFPCLALCYEAMRLGGNASIVLNAANEIAVDAFLESRLGFTGIAHVIEQCLVHADTKSDISSLQLILDADAHARALARELVDKAPNRLAV